MSIVTFQFYLHQIISMNYVFVFLTSARKCIQIYALTYYLQSYEVILFKILHRQHSYSEFENISILCKWLGQ